MTITELLDNLGAAFPAFNARALEAWASVYRARLGKHEGPRLAQAYVDTLSAFSVAKTKSLFPVPADFEPHLPMQSLKLAHGTKLDLVGHRQRKTALFVQWWQMQGGRIREARGTRIAQACAWEVSRMAHDAAWKAGAAAILLTVDQINICEGREVSSERMATFGPYALRRPDPTQWREQMAAARETVRHEMPVE